MPLEATECFLCVFCLQPVENSKEHLYTILHTYRPLFLKMILCVACCMNIHEVVYKLLWLLCPLIYHASIIVLENLLELY